MKKRLIALLLALAMIASCCLYLASCQDNEGNSTTSAETEQSTEATTEATTNVTTEATTKETTEVTTHGTSGETTEATTVVTTEATTEETTEISTVDDPYAAVYEDGEEMSEAGIEWDSDAFASVDHEIVQDGAKDISPDALLALVTDGTIDGTKTYRVSGDLALAKNVSYDFKGAGIIANVSITSGNNATLSNAVILGKITVKNSTGVTIDSVDIKGDANAIITEGTCTDLLIKNCRISATDVAVVAGGDDTAVYKSYITADVGVQVDADAVIVQNCHLVTVKEAVSGKGESVVIRENLIETPADASAIKLDSAQNGLVALNVIKGSQSSVVIKSSYNCAIIYNNVVRVIAKNNKNLYIVKNSVSGRIIVENNNYLICDTNTSPADNKIHDTYSIGNRNANGDNVTDVNARAEVGANEEILPHTNKDLFVGMTRYTTIRDLDSAEKVNLYKYLQNCTANDLAIVPPGVYLSNNNLSLSDNCNGLQVYAYGVMHEKSDYGQTLVFAYSSNISIHGLTVGYVNQSAGQVHVVKKLGNNQLLVVPAAGYENLLSKPNGGFTDWFTKDENGNTALYPIYSFSHETVENGDGTATMTLKGDGSIAEYDNVQVGDIIVCRLPGANTNSVAAVGAHNILLKDFTIYGYSNALAFVAQGGSSNMTFERVHNTARAPYILDQSTYTQYKEWEEKYDVDLEIYVDEYDRYRGSTPRIGSVDATHLSGAKTGLTVISSTFEQMTDDGSNHHGMSSRLHNVIDNEDGTAFIYYKGNISQTYFNSGSTTNCEQFSEGDRIFVYCPATGKLLCDTVCLGDAKKNKDLTMTVEGKTFKTTIYRVKVSAEDIDFSAIEDLDLSDNHYKLDEDHFLVDNISYVSAGIKFDNVLIQNHRSRGFLMKTRDAEVINSTFRNIGHTGILMYIEPSWGESTVTQNIVVDKCLFDHVGYINRRYDESTISPIYIGGFGDDITGSDMLTKDITVNGCKFINNEHEVLLGVHSAQNVTITNNDFGYRKVGGEDTVGVAIDIKNAKNVFIEGNTYVGPVTEVIKAENYKGVTGKDTVDESGNTLFPDNVKAPD